MKVSLGRGWVALYAHLAGWRVRVGEQVSAGQRLGTAGCTGWCTGTHLHFELRHFGLPVNPLRFRQKRDVRSSASFCFSSGGISSTAACLTNAPQLLLEAVALAAVGAEVEVRLGLGPLGVGELTVEVGLQELFALVARIDFRTVGHQALPTASSASSRFRIRRPRCRRDMTVPIGISRICAASA